MTNAPLIPSYEDLITQVVDNGEPTYLLFAFVGHLPDPAAPQGRVAKVVATSSQLAEKGMTFAKLAADMQDSSPTGSEAAGWEVVFIHGVIKVGSGEELNGFLNRFATEVENDTLPDGFVCFNREGAPVAPLRAGPDGNPLQ